MVEIEMIDAILVSNDGTVTVKRYLLDPFDPLQNPKTRREFEYAAIPGNHENEVDSWAEFEEMFADEKLSELFAEPIVGADPESFGTVEAGTLGARLLQAWGMAEYVAKPSRTELLDDFGGGIALYPNDAATESYVRALMEAAQVSYSEAVHERLMTVGLLHFKGMAVTEISEVCGVSRSTVYQWLDDYAREMAHDVGERLSPREIAMRLGRDPQIVREWMLEAGWEV